MKKSYRVKVAFLAIIALSALQFQARAQQRHATRPNIILILTDDMGYSDLGCYGSEIATPHLDSLAMHGLRYTQFYNVGHCCPSRASLMTGLYPHQTGLGWMTARKFDEPGYTDELNNHCVTIAQVLKGAGYATFMTGKWHLCRDVHAGDPNYNWPLQRGFDKFYGILEGAGNYYDPAALCRGNTLITPENDTAYQPEHFYFTRAISDNSVRFIQDRPRDRPFFMYVAYTAAHWPMQAPEADIEKYKGHYDAGWGALRTERLKREKALGVIDSSTTLSPLEAMPWEQEPDKPAMERRMETYAAMISVMDEGVGKIVKELKKEGLFDNTIILFLQDNGGNGEGTGFGGPGGATKSVAKDTSGLAPMNRDEVQYAVIPTQTRDGRAEMMGKRLMAGPADTYLAYLKPWGELSNTPFRKYKNFSYEGGVATPLIIHWPRGITAARGAIRKQVAHEIDIMPTLVELTGAHYPARFKGESITPEAGVSLVGTFQDSALEHRAVYFAHEGNRAVRMGDWKIVSGGIMHGPYGKWKTLTRMPWQLYDMKNDRSELKDLSAEYPERVARMAQMWEKWAREVHVYPMPWKEERPPLQSYYMSTPWQFPDF